MEKEQGQTSAPAIVPPAFQHMIDPAPQPLSLNDQAKTAERVRLQGFLEKINKLPPLDSVDKTPDGKAFTILISHIEMTLDEYFFGLWETYDFKWAVIANEVVGSLTLEVTHPVNGLKLRRTGAAAIQIMVDKAPDDVAKDRIEKNRWANNPDNKKPSALDMGFPKLKAECLKNAAQSFGKLFGRDLNREKSDSFKPIQKDKADKATAATENLLNNK
jgi:hypothetical protein